MARLSTLSNFCLSFIMITNLAFILDFTSPEITANKVKQGTK